MKRSPLPTEKPDLFDLCQCNVITLEDTTSNICKNEWAGLTPSGHTHYLNMVFKIPLVTLKHINFWSKKICVERNFWVEKIFG